VPVIGSGAVRDEAYHQSQREAANTLSCTQSGKGRRRNEEAK